MPMWISLTKPPYFHRFLQNLHGALYTGFSSSLYEWHADLFGRYILFRSVATVEAEEAAASSVLCSVRQKRQKSYVIN